MASHPFRTARPTGAPSAGGSVHTLGAHIASGSPHPQYLKKGDEVPTGNLSGHENDPNAHTRYFLSRAELGSDAAAFLATLNVDNVSNYSQDAIAKYIVTTKMFHDVLGMKTVLAAQFEALVSKWDVVVDPSGATIADNGAKKPVTAYSLFKRLYDVVNSMFYGVTGLAVTDDLGNKIYPAAWDLFSANNDSTSIRSNPLYLMFSAIGHTHTPNEVRDADGNIAAVVGHTHGEYALVNHLHDGSNGLPKYLTMDDLEGEWLTRDALREVGIFEQTVKTPVDIKLLDYDLNRYTTQGNFSFQMSGNMFLDTDAASVLENSNFPDIFINAVKKQIDTTLRLVASEDLNAVNAASILSVKSVTEDDAVFGETNLTDFIVTGNASKTGRVVQQILTTNSPIKRNEYTSSLDVPKYKDNTRKLYSRTGYALEYAWYISTIAHKILGLTPEHLYGTDPSRAVERLAQAFYGYIDAAHNDLPPLCEVGYSAYPYFTTPASRRLRAGAEMVDRAVDSSGARVFKKAESSRPGRNRTGNVLSRDISGWLMPGYYDRNSTDANLDHIAINTLFDNVAKVVMPVDTGVYLPYLRYFVDKSDYPPITNAANILVQTGFVYYTGTTASAVVIENKYDTSVTTNPDASVVSSIADRTSVISNSGVVESAPPACVFNGIAAAYNVESNAKDPYLYEMSRITTDLHAGLVWSDSSATSGYTPLYVIAKDQYGNYLKGGSRAYSFVEIHPADGITIGSPVFVQSSTLSSGNALLVDERKFKWDSENHLFCRLSVTDELPASDIYIYTGSDTSVLSGGNAEIYCRKYVVSGTGSSTYMQWNKILITGRSQDEWDTITLGQNENVYYYDTAKHMFVALTDTDGNNLHRIPPYGAIQDDNGNTISYDYPLYRDPVIRERHDFKEVVSSLSNQYVVPKLTHNLPALSGVTYVEFSGTDVNAFNSSPDYTTGYDKTDTSTQKSFIIVGEDALAALIEEKGYSYTRTNDPTPVSGKTYYQAIYNPTGDATPVNGVEYFTHNDGTYTYSSAGIGGVTLNTFVSGRTYYTRTLQDATGIESFNPQTEYYTKESRVRTPTSYKLVHTDDPALFEISSPGLTYKSELQYFIKSGSTYTAATVASIFESDGAGGYAGLKSSVDKSTVYCILADTETDKYILPGTTLQANKYGVRLPRYQFHLDTSGATAVYTKSVFFPTLDTAPVSGKTYYTSVGDLFTAIASADVQSSMNDSDTTVYEAITVEDIFDTWCAIQQLTTVGATTELSLDSDDDKLVYNFDREGELVTWDAWQELVTHGDPSFVTFESRTNEFVRLADVMLPWLNDVQPAIDNNLVEYGFKTAQNKPKYDDGFDAVFKHAKWFGSLTEGTATLLCGTTTATANITTPSIEYTTSGSNVEGSYVADSSTGTTTRVTWTKSISGGSTVSVPLANLEDLAKYARGDWVYSLQTRLSTLENSLDTTSYFETLDSVPVTGRIYYVKSGNTYVEAGRGGVDGFAFSVGITYYESSNVAVRLEELEHIWEWFENNVQSGGGSLVINETHSDVCIDAFLNYDKSANEITRGTTIRLCGYDTDANESVYVLVPTAQVNNGVRVDSNLSGDIIGSNTKVRIMDIDEGDYDPYEFSIVLKCDDAVTNGQNKEIENPMAEILVPKANTSPVQYQGAMYVPANSLLWVVKTGTNHGVYFRVPQSWVDLYDLGSNNSTYHVYLRRKFYASTSTPGLGRANRILVHKSST